MIFFLLQTSYCLGFCFFFSSRRRHTRCLSDWSSDVCSSDLLRGLACAGRFGLCLGRSESGVRLVLASLLSVATQSVAFGQRNLVVALGLCNGHVVVGGGLRRAHVLFLGAHFLVRICRSLVHILLGLFHGLAGRLLGLIDLLIRALPGLSDVILDILRTFGLIAGRKRGGQRQGHNTQCCDAHVITPDGIH